MTKEYRRTKLKKPDAIKEPPVSYAVRPSEAEKPKALGDFFDSPLRVSPDFMENYRPERSERKVAKVFMSGRSQAVRLPKEYRMPGDEVYVEKVGDQLILSPKVKTLEDLFAGLPLLTDDFPDEIPDLPLQERDAL